MFFLMQLNLSNDDCFCQNLYLSVEDRGDIASPIKLDRRRDPGRALIVCPDTPSIYQVL